MFICPDAGNVVIATDFVVSKSRFSDKEGPWRARSLTVILLHQRLDLDVALLCRLETRQRGVNNTVLKFKVADLDGLE